ncbi:hypothetical protein EVAR_10288_1 [Eumeta japonica]|uniref:Uncharacterized protein n=1 Tax=Eumeta variegata TaxID=151549 RepID=A0A4C1TDM7_EUMVA|nr:hypothetical protein EVAR_10288_1 [Eumeta japonica]
MTSLKPGKVYNSQSHEIIHNVYKFMEKEAYASKSQVFEKSHFQNIQDRTAQATGVSRKTVKSILDEADTSTSTGLLTFSTPKKKKIKKEHRLALDDFDYQVIRQKNL